MRFVLSVPLTVLKGDKEKERNITFNRKTCNNSVKSRKTIKHLLLMFRIRFLFERDLSKWRAKKMSAFMQFNVNHWVVTYIITANTFRFLSRRKS
jgi:predicted sugar kinase